jgi:hypothetical protein
VVSIPKLGQLPRRYQLEQPSTHPIQLLRAQEAAILVLFQKKSPVDLLLLFGATFELQERWLVVLLKGRAPLEFLLHICREEFWLHADHYGVLPVVLVLVDRGAELGDVFGVFLAWIRPEIGVIRDSNHPLDSAVPCKPRVASAEDELMITFKQVQVETCSQNVVIEKAVVL